MQSSPSMRVTRSNRLLPLLVSPLHPKVVAPPRHCSMRTLSRIPSVEYSFMPALAMLHAELHLHSVSISIADELV